jgi:hypothetical protein
MYEYEIVVKKLIGKKRTETAMFRDNTLWLLVDALTEYAYEIEGKRDDENH